MTTSEFFRWIVKADQAHEDSWSDVTNRFNLNYHEAVFHNKPTHASVFEYQMANLITDIICEDDIQHIKEELDNQEGPQT